MYNLQLISCKIGISLCILFILCGFPFIAIAQNGYVAPRKSSETAKYEYNNSHYTNTTSRTTIIIAVPTKKDDEIIQNLARGADITNDAYYAKMIDESNAQYIRNGVLPPSKESWLRTIENIRKNEWPAKWPTFYPSIDSGYATVKQRGRYGVIDTTGKIIIPIIWQYASIFRNGLAFVQTMGPDSKTGFMNKANKLVIPLKYEDCYLGFSEGVAAVKLNGKWGFIDVNDDTAIPFLYDEVTAFKDGFAVVKQNKKYGVIDKTGIEIIPIKYQAINQLTLEKIFVFKQKDKWGAFDEKGKVIIEPIYKEHFYFYKGKAEVTLKSRTFYIDTTGNEVPAL